MLLPRAPVFLLRLPALRRRAFSLVEVTLALAVFAIAIVALLALLPTAFNTSQRGRAETYAAQIGRFVLSDLRAGTFTQARVATGPDPSDVELVSFETAVTKYLLFDANGRPTSAANVSYDNGAPGGAYLVRITGVPTPSPTAGIVARQSAVTVSVEAPAPAKKDARTKFTFTTIISR